MAIARLPGRTLEIVPTPQATIPGSYTKATGEMLEVGVPGAAERKEAKPPKPGDVSNDDKDKVKAAASETKAAPDTQVVWWSIAAVIVALVLISLLTSTPSQPPALASGVSIFALLYIAAQGTERLLEPVASLIDTTSDKELERDKKAAQFRNEQTAEAGREAATSQAQLDKKRANRRVAFWAAGTVLGMAASGGLGIYLLRMVGLSTAPEIVDILLTGLVISGGSKPLHDLISRIEKAKNNESDPPETRAGTIS
jgi:hypothetical protein